jgi:hypothetical protein
MAINLKEVLKKNKATTKITTIKILQDDLTFIRENNINLNKVIDLAIADLRKQVKG